MYHEIGGDLLTRHLRFLKKNFRIITLDELYSGIASNKVPERSIVITFDDGYLSHYTEVFPRLVGTNDEFWFDKIKNMRRIMIKRKLDTGQLDKRDFKNIPDSEKDDIIDDVAQKINYKSSGRDILNWEEVAEMHKSGLVTFGAHTHTHPILPNIDDKRVNEELKLSKSALEKKLRNKVRHFSYPNGNYNKRHVKQVESAGYLTSTTTNPGVNTGKTDPYLLYRIGVGTTNSVAVLAVKTSALWYKLNKIRFDWDNRGQNENVA
jgi:peptidoglycan/xylan/chitin deacetylase (PgdA/CDA1 family)